LWLKRGEQYTAFADRMARLKRDIFPFDADEPVILHREEIVSYRGRFQVLRDPSVAKKWQSALLELVSESTFTMVLVHVDKARLAEAYLKPHHPYHYALDGLVERFGFWLSDHDVNGDFVVEARGKREDQLLEARFREICAAGTPYLKRETAQRVFTSKSLKLKRKAENTPGLQLADLLAYTMKDRVLCSLGLMPPQMGFDKELAETAFSKYRKSGTGKVEGWGIVAL
jgi:hypothetical protein